jgi:hypothetical protein
MATRPSRTTAGGKAAEAAKQHRTEQLEAKLQRKNEVLSELMEEHAQLKKEWYWSGM